MLMLGQESGRASLTIIREGLLQRDGFAPCDTFSLSGNRSTRSVYSPPPAREASHTAKPGRRWVGVDDWAARSPATLPRSMPLWFGFSRRVCRATAGRAAILAPAQCSASARSRTGYAIDGETLGRPGERRHWELSYQPARDAAGAVVGVTILISDQTEQQAPEAARQ